MDESSDHFQSSSSGEQLYRRVFTPKDCSPEQWRGGVLMVHGMGDHLGCHEQAARMFCRQGLVAAGLDWPGHGQSDGKRGHLNGVDPLMDLISESLADLRERLPTGLPIGLYAHSAGALVLLQFLKEQASLDAEEINRPSSFPFVWLSSPLLRPAHGQGFLKVKIGEWLSKIAPGLCLDTGVRSDSCYRPDPDKGQQREDSLKHHKISLALGSDFMKRSRTVNECALAFEEPTRLLISQGGEDKICPVNFSQAFFDAVSLSDENKTYLLLPEVLHEPLNDPVASKLLETVGEWVDETLKACSDTP